MRIRAPEGGQSFLDHQPAMFGAFNRLYGRLWTDGRVDQPTKETARLRNARVVDCKL